MRIIILSLFFLLPMGLFSQTDSGGGESGGYFRNRNNRSFYAYSVGFKFLSIEAFPKILDQTNPDALRLSKFNGLVLKYNDNQISYRIAGNFFSDNISIKNECDNCETLKGKLTDNHIKIGFEKNITYATIQPYFGFDLGFKRSVFRGDAYSEAMSQRALSTYDVKTEKNGVSLSPVLGIKFNLVDHFTIAAESSFDVLYSYERQEKAYAGTVGKYHKWEYLVKPVGMLSLQYNFGEIY